MRKRIVLISILTGCIIFGGLTFIIKLNNKNESKDIIVVNKTTTQNSDETIESKIEETKEVVITEEVNKEITAEVKKEEQKKNEITLKTTKPKVQESTTSKVTTTKKVEEVTEKVEDSKVEPNKQTEEKKEKPIWEYFNMTEYEYYNEPLYKWEHADFAVSKYGSEKACQDACMAYGYEYEPYKNGEVSFICSTVNTASGKYLGEWFHTEKLTK